MFSGEHASLSGSNSVVKRQTSGNSSNLSSSLVSSFQVQNDYTNSHDVLLAQYVDGNMVNLGEDYSNNSNSTLKSGVSEITENVDKFFLD